MRIGFEIDGMLRFHADAAGAPIEQARETLMEVRAAGHQVVLYTSFDSSLALDIEAWLSKNKMPYDAIIFNRPRMMTLFFAPDARQFTSWDTTRSELIRHGVLQEGKARNENTGGAEGGRAAKNLKARRQDTKVLDKKPGGAGRAEPEKGQSGFQVLK